MNASLLTFAVQQEQRRRRLRLSYLLETCKPSGEQQGKPSEDVAAGLKQDQNVNPRRGERKNGSAPRSQVATSQQAVLKSKDGGPSTAPSANARPRQLTAAQLRALHTLKRLHPTAMLLAWQGRGGGAGGRGRAGLATGLVGRGLCKPFPWGHWTQGLDSSDVRPSDRESITDGADERPGVLGMGLDRQLSQQRSPAPDATPTAATGWHQPAEPRLDAGPVQPNGTGPVRQRDDAGACPRTGGSPTDAGAPPARQQPQAQLHQRPSSPPLDRSAIESAVWSLLDNFAFAASTAVHLAWTPGLDPASFPDFYGSKPCLGMLYPDIRHSVAGMHARWVHDRVMDGANLCLAKAKAAAMMAIANAIDDTKQISAEMQAAPRFWRLWWRVWFGGEGRSLRELLGFLVELEPAPAEQTQASSSQGGKYSADSGDNWPLWGAIDGRHREAWRLLADSVSRAQSPEDVFAMHLVLGRAICGMALLLLKERYVGYGPLTCAAMATCYVLIQEHHHKPSSPDLICQALEVGPLQPSICLHPASEAAQQNWDAGMSPEMVDRLSAENLMWTIEAVAAWPWRLLGWLNTHEAVLQYQAEGGPDGGNRSTAAKVTAAHEDLAGMELLFYGDQDVPPLVLDPNMRIVPMVQALTTIQPHRSGPGGICSLLAAGAAGSACAGSANGVAASDGDGGPAAVPGAVISGSSGVGAGGRSAGTVTGRACRLLRIILDAWSVRQTKPRQHTLFADVVQGQVKSAEECTLVLIALYYREGQGQGALVFQTEALPMRSGREPEEGDGELELAEEAEDWPEEAEAGAEGPLELLQRPSVVRLTLHRVQRVASRDDPGYKWAEIKPRVHVITATSGLSGQVKSLKDGLVRRRLLLMWVRSQGTEGTRRMLYAVAQVQAEMQATNRDLCATAVYFGFNQDEPEQSSGKERSKHDAAAKRNTEQKQQPQDPQAHLQPEAKGAEDRPGPGADERFDPKQAILSAESAVHRMRTSLRRLLDRTPREDLGMWLVQHPQNWIAEERQAAESIEELLRILADPRLPKFEIELLLMECHPDTPADFVRPEGEQVQLEQALRVKREKEKKLSDIMFQE